MTNRWHELSAKFYALPAQRRGIWLGLILLVLTILMLTRWYLPTSDERQVAAQQLRQLQQEQILLEQQRQETEALLAGDPNQELTALADSLTGRLVKLDEAIAEETAYVSARDNRALLQAILAEATEVEVIGAEAMPAEAFGEAAEDSEEAKATAADRDSSTGIYQHRLQLRLRGDYFAVRDYLKALDNLPWSFYWHRLDYDVGSYPNAVVEIEIYTLSAERDYVGV